MFDIDIDIVSLWQTEKEVDDNNLPAVCSKMSVFPSSPHLATKKSIGVTRHRQGQNDVNVLSPS